MFFHIEHTTEYVYSEPATEAFSELRLRPRDSLRQKVFRHHAQIQPSVPIDSYTDYFGNFVETISIPFRHKSLSVTSHCDVVTSSFADALSALDLTLSEARQIYGARARDLHDFLQPSPLAPFNRPLREMADRLLAPSDGFTAAIKRLNEYIFTRFKYTPGATHVATPVEEFLERKKGVCQDFAHLMISLCRNAGVPARYVSGYIETEPQTPSETETKERRRVRRLIGATASHAWVEIYAPNHFWVGFDPTNNLMEGEQHVQIGIGRDYRDVPPLKGIVKGATKQRLSVKVEVTRDEITPLEESETSLEDPST
jgi:transglutaminase-like putative cysteine protease